MSVRALIVDDEPVARRRLQRMLGELSEIRVVGVAGSVPDARRLIESERPDVLFVDVEMPGEAGLRLLDGLEAGRLPVAVIVSAHANYALDAFEGAAVDYVLKPVRGDRLRTTAARVVAFARALQERATDRPTESPRLVVSVGRRLVPIEVGAIDWIRADENYVWLHVSGKGILHRATLAGVLAELSPGPFVRVHRSAAVNLRRVAAARQVQGGGIVIELTTGERVSMSRGYRDRLPYLLTGRPTAR